MLRGDATFGMRHDPAEVQRRTKGFDVERSVAAFDDGEMVGTSSVISLEVTLPGLSRVPAAGLAHVGVMPTHRRRGILTRMMRRQLDDVHRRGEPVSLLTASEGGIYGRFGFGPATWHATYRIERRAAAQRLGLGPGSTWLVDLGVAARLAPEVFDQARRGQPGDVARPETWWEDILADNERAPDGGRAVFSVLHTQPDGLVDGYAVYWIEGAAAVGRGEPGLVRVRELCAVSQVAYARLWAYLCDIDLTGLVEAPRRPLDEPFRWLLLDPAQLQLVSWSDHIWARLVDLPLALSQRSYTGSGALVLDVRDAFCPWNEGLWRLEVDGGQATVERAAGTLPDLSLDTSDLSSAFLGGVSMSSLRRGGRVSEHRPGASSEADVLFSCDPGPFCASSF